MHYPEHQMQLPDTDARRRATLLVALVTVGVIAALVTIERSMGSTANLTREEIDMAMGGLGFTLQVLAAGSGLLLFTMSAWLLRTSYNAWSSERFPPAGTQVIRATEILTGAAARRKATMGFLLAGFVAISGLVSIFTLWKIAESMTAM